MKLESSDRGPLIIAGGIVVAGIFIALALFLGRSVGGDADVAPPPFDPRASATPIAASPTIDPSAANRKTTGALMDVADAAAAIGITDGTFMNATTLAMSQRVPRYTYLPSTRPSDRPTQLSMLPQDVTWSAAALSESGTCFWIRLTLAEGEVFRAYGTGAPCTGRAAQSAAETAFPA